MRWWQSRKELIMILHLLLGNKRNRKGIAVVIVKIFAVSVSLVGTLSECDGKKYVSVSEPLFSRWRSKSKEIETVQTSTWLPVPSFPPRKCEEIHSHDKLHLKFHFDFQSKDGVVSRYLIEYIELFWSARCRPLSQSMSCDYSQRGGRRSFLVTSISFHERTLRPFQRRSLWYRRGLNAHDKDTLTKVQRE